MNKRTMMKFKHLFRRGHNSSNGPPNNTQELNSSSHIDRSADSSLTERIGDLEPVASVNCWDANTVSSAQQQCSSCSFPLGNSKYSSGVNAETIKKEMESAARIASLEARIQELISCHGELETLKRDISRLQEEKQQLQQEILEGVQPAATTSINDIAAIIHNRNYASLSETSVPPEVMSPPDWDKNSSSSEVSVACLQDRIMQMEETHYSTNEELQATLQELTDLQTQLTDLQNDNERLGEEKDVLLDSLVRQAEELIAARNKMGTLQGLLADNPGTVGTTEREQQLIDLLKGGQEERAALLTKQETFFSEMSELRRRNDFLLHESSRLSERVQQLEQTVDATHEERKFLDLELAQAKEESSSRHLEINRLNSLLEQSKSKIKDFERTAKFDGEKLDLQVMLDESRKDIYRLEQEAILMEEDLTDCQGEIVTLRTRIFSLQEECNVLKTNTHSAVNEMEHECEQWKSEKTNLTRELEALQNSYSQLMVQNNSHVEENLRLTSLLTETQKHLGQCEKSLDETKKELEKQINFQSTERKLWDQFQSDLLCSVRVANDIKNEAQVEIDKLIEENNQLREMIKDLESEVDTLKLTEKQPCSKTTASVNTSPTITSASQEMSRQRKNSPPDCRLSVKSLIESIENVTKKVKTGHGSLLSNSTSSLHNIPSLPQSVSTSPVNEYEFKSPLPLRDQQQLSNVKQFQKKKSIFSEETFKITKPSTEEAVTQTPTIFSRNLEFGRKSSSCDLSERKDPLAGLAKNGGSKRNALLKWCQNKTLGYNNIDITNFSSSWNDGLALCAIMHSYLPDRVAFDTLTPNEKRRNFITAFSAAESVGITTTLNINDMIQQERPDWQLVMAYITSIYKHFET